MRKLPPHSNEIEETIVASVFLDGITTIQACLDKKVCEDSFFKEENRLLWKTFIWAFKRGTPLEIDAISTALLEKDKLGKVGGTEYLLKVTNRVPTTVGTKHAIDKLQELYMLREIISRSNEIIEDAHSYTGDISVFYSKLAEALKIKEGLEKTATLSTACDEIGARIDRILKGETLDGENGLDWPWRDATRYLGPIGAELVILAARPSKGKSAVARQMAWCWSQRYGNVMLFSREMPMQELTPLFSQSLSGVSWREIRNGRSTLKDISTFKEGLAQVKANSTLSIFDKDRTLSQIVARVKAQCIIKPPCAIIIDYLQIYDPEQSKSENRDQALGRFTRTLQDLTMELRCPVVLLCQVNRSSEREERDIRLSDLRESGSIEQDASRVVSIAWDAVDANGQAVDFNDQSISTIPSVRLIQLKGRGDGQATTQLQFHRPTASFLSLG